MKIAIVAAIGKRGELGRNGELPWRIKEDLEFFKILTQGNTVVMGRKTFATLPNPIRDRTIIVLTTKGAVASSISHPCDVLVMGTIGEVMEYAYEKNLETLYVAGGGEMYKHFLPLATSMHLTRVNAEFDADVYFPEYAYSDWTMKKVRYSNNGDFEYSFEYYERAK